MANEKCGHRLYTNGRNIIITKYQCKSIGLVTLATPLILGRSRCVSALAVHQFLIFLLLAPGSLHGLDLGKISLGMGYPLEPPDCVRHSRTRLYTSASEKQIVRGIPICEVTTIGASTWKLCLPASEIRHEEANTTIKQSHQAKQTGIKHWYVTRP